MADESYFSNTQRPIWDHLSLSHGGYRDAPPHPKFRGVMLLNPPKEPSYRHSRQNPEPPLCPFLGVGVRWDDTPHGGKGNHCVVQKVFPGGPADKAGIIVNDHLAEWDGQPLQSEETWKKMVSTSRMGQLIPFHVVRKGRSRKVYILVEGVQPAPR
eukprot:EG_transcript_39864